MQPGEEPIGNPAVEALRQMLLQRRIGALAEGAASSSVRAVPTIRSFGGSKPSESSP